MITSPIHTVCALVALQRALVVHPAAAVRLRVVDEQPVLQVLARRRRSTARAARRRRRAPRTAPTAPAGPRRRPASPPCAAAARPARAARGGATGAPRRPPSPAPLTTRQRRPVTDHELHVVRVGRAARVVQHDHSPARWPHLDQHVPERRPRRVLPAHARSRSARTLTVSGGTVTTWPRSNEANARALTRSAGTKAVPSRGHRVAARSTVTPGAASTATATFAAGSAADRHAARAAAAAA